MCEMSSYLVATSRSCSRATIINGICTYYIYCKTKINGRRPWPNFWMCQGTYVPDICWHLIHIHYISVSYSVAWGHLKPCKLTMCGRVRWSTFEEALLSYLDVEICRVSVYAEAHRSARHARTLTHGQKSMQKSFTAACWCWRLNSWVQNPFLMVLREMQWIGYHVAIPD